MENGYLNRNVAEEGGRQPSVHASNEAMIAGGMGLRARSRPHPGRRGRGRVRLATLNMNGFGRQGTDGSTDKWLGINQVMKDHRLVILTLQETHLTPERLATLNKLFASQLLILATYDEQNPTAVGGVAFVIARCFLRDAVDPELRVILPGRAATVTIPWTTNKSLTFLGVYAPNDSRDNAAFWTSMHESYERRDVTTPRPHFLLGDFNVVEDPLDRLPHHGDSGEAVVQLRRLLTTLDLNDEWRRTNAGVRTYSFLQKATGSQSRIDRIYVARGMQHAVADWMHGPPGFPTDHDLVLCSVANYAAPSLGNGRWSLPLHLLEDPDFTATMRAVGLRLQNTMCNLRGRSEALNPQIIFHEFKRELVRAARNRMKIKVTSAMKRTSTLRGQINSVLNPGGSRLLTDKEVRTAAILQDKLASVVNAGFGAQKQISLAKDWVLGERIGKYWTRMNAAQLPDGTFYEMKRLDAGRGSPQYANHTPQMCEIASSFYDGLQKVDPPESEDSHTADVQAVLDEWQLDMPEEYKEPLTEPITADEVSDALQSAAMGRSPGLDGLPVEVYKRYDEWAKAASKNGKPHLDMAKVLQMVFNDVEEHGVAKDVPFADGWICPIYKLKGDTRDITNYRPITLLNADYKLLTRVLAQRLVEPAGLLVHPDQAGFLPGRRIHDNIRLTRTALDYAEASGFEGVVVALDQEKAYDRIDHAYLWRLLEKLGFPPRFVNTVRALYRAARSAVMVNGTLSRFFAIERGVRQGDPMSCLLFNLAIEPLAVALRASTLRGIDIPGLADRLITSLYADDTTVYLHVSDQYSVLTNILERWCRASRAKFNVSKTEVIPLGPKDARQHLLEHRRFSSGALCIPGNVHLVPEGETVRILGAQIGNDADPTLAWERVLRLIETNFQRWGKRRPTMYGRKLAVGLEAASRTQFLAMAQGMPATVEARLQNLISNFMWGGNRPAIAKDVLYSAVSEGGLALVDIGARNSAIELMWLKSYLDLQPSRPKWAYIADALFANAAAATSKSVPEDLRSNAFLQTWDVSTRRAAGLPTYLRSMILAAKKYDVHLAPVLPSEEVRLALPIWYHIGQTKGRTYANSAVAKCLRDTHRVLTVANALSLVGRLANPPSEGRPHVPSARCQCLMCVNDRDVLRCDNPHRCALAAKKALDRFEPLWHPQGWRNEDGLSVTRSGARRNQTARAANEDIVFDPSVTTTLPIAANFRVFAGSEGLRNGMPKRPPRPFGVRQEDTTVYTDGSCTVNDGVETTAGSGVWFGEGDERNIAERVCKHRNTNQVAELYAVELAITAVPAFAPLHIVTDSKYVVNGLTQFLGKWEDRGWIDVANAALVRAVAARLRARSAVTTFRWVKGHSGIIGNEGADKLAAAGALRGADSGCALPPAPLEYVGTGVKLSVLTQRLAYKGIRSAAAKQLRKASCLRTLQVQEAAKEWKQSFTVAALWKSLRAGDMRRTMRDFWWKALHDALRIGRYWKHIPLYENRERCPVCDEEEDLEHVLLTCRCTAVSVVWQLVDAVLAKAGIQLPPKSLGAVLAAPCFDIKGIMDEASPGLTRLTRIILTESVHLIWVLRCERVIDPPFVGGARDYDKRSVVTKWLYKINRRLTIDQRLVHKRLGSAAMSRCLVLGTWDAVLIDRHRLPDDWILAPGVLVGNPCCET